MQPLNEKLRNMPQIDEILKNIEIAAFSDTFIQNRIRDIVREQTERVRKQLIVGELKQADRHEILNIIVKSSAQGLEKEASEKSKRVINGTGIIIHTNLGRSPLSEKAALMVYNLSTAYSNLEYSTAEGKRKNRLRFVEKQICDITGAEAALVVNNNAAAVFLALNSLCKGKEVIVSRGEIVEIGGSFRISEVVEASGAVVKEVGTTNKTYIKDIEKAVCENTGVILKMHTSNFKVVGFTADVNAKDLCVIGCKRGVPVMEDMGSGVLIDLRELGLRHERQVQDAVKDGVDIITFSGDKMLGGPQCGIIAGKAEYINKMRENQLMRCMRVDKMCLVALEATISHYFKKGSILEIPIYKKMAEPLDSVKLRAEKLKKIIDNPKASIEIKPHDAQFGGGSLPFESISSYAVYISSEHISAAHMDNRLRNSDVAVIGTIQNNEYILDLRSIDDDDFNYLGVTFRKLFEETK